MATYHQYSEIVAAYGYRLPPPPQPEGQRVGLSLLYAVVGVALGTLTGTALAVVSAQPGATMSHHFRFASSASAGFHIRSLANVNVPPVANAGVHPLANLNLQPVAANASIRPSASADPLPAVIAGARPLANLSLKPASGVDALRVSNASPTAAHTYLSTPAAKVKIAFAAKSMTRAATPVKLHFAPHFTHKWPAIQPSIPAASTAAISTTTTQSTTQSIATADAAVKAAQPSTASPAPVFLSLPAAAQTSLNAGAKAMLFYSEGDVTVADYDASAGTIQTTDGKTFVVGPTVSQSNAPSWDDYRANVHYRCDQSGSCMLVRAGVVALNAKMI